MAGQKRQLLVSERKRHQCRVAGRQRDRCLDRELIRDAQAGGPIKIEYNRLINRFSLQFRLSFIRERDKMTMTDTSKHGQ